jgi:hypothetical protein
MFWESMLFQGAKGVDRKIIRKSGTQETNPTGKIFAA